MHTYTECLAAEVRADMGRQRITGRQLADQIPGMTQATIARQLRGVRPWDVESLNAAAGVLQVSVVDWVARAQAAFESQPTPPQPTPSESGTSTLP